MKLGPIQTLWIAEMRAHPERQFKERLGYRDSDKTLHLCCLGQLLIVANDCKWTKDNNLTTLTDDYSGIDDYIKYGLRSSLGQLKRSFGKYSELSQMNDIDMTWLEIVDYIVANPNNVFTKSV